MIKLIASDLDGTLVKDSSPEVYPEFLRTILELKRKGIHFVAASGRQYASIHKMFKEVESDIDYIACNGAHIIANGTTLAVTALQDQYARRIIRQLREYEGECEFEVTTPEGGFVESTDKSFIDLLKYGYRDDLHVIDDVLTITAPIMKLSFYKRGSVRTIGEGTLIPQWKDLVKVCMSGEEWVDFMAPEVDKGAALLRLQKHYGISREETLSFGDNPNDIGLLQAAGISYAVENARDEVKIHANHICSGFEQKGVNEIICTLCNL